MHKAMGMTATLLANHEARRVRVARRAMAAIKVVQTRGVLRKDEVTMRGKILLTVAVTVIVEAM